MHGVVVWLTQVELLQKLLEPFSVFSPVNGVGLGADNFHARFRQGYGQVERGLAAELDDDAVRLFLVDDIEHIFSGERLKEQLVGGIIVGGDGFRIGVDHDRFNADFP